MKIALISSSSGSRGGGELYLCGLARGLTDLGHEVRSVLSQHGRMDELAEMLRPFGPIHRVPYCNTYDRKLRSVGAVWAGQEIRQLQHELSRLPVDVLHLNKQNLEDGLDLLAAMERTHIPSVATIHVTRTMRQLGSLGGRVRDWVTVRALRSSNLPLIPTAHRSLDDLKQLGVPARRLHLVWNGVTSAPDADRDKFRADWGCKTGDVVLGCVARIEPQKNPLFLPHILAQLPPHVRLVWVGDGSLRSALEQSIRDAGVAERVVLTGWQTDARRLMAGFDAFVLPSLYEGFPFAILEAMAAKLPCIVSDVDGVAEAVLHGHTGFVCPVNDAAAWLTALRQGIENPDSLISMGERGFQRYRDHFSVDAMARQTIAVYESALARSKSTQTTAGSK